MLLQLVQRLGLHAAQEHARVNLPIKALSHRMAAVRQIQRSADRGQCVGLFAGRLPMLTGPTHQCIAPQRNAHHHQHLAACLAVLGPQSAQNPVNLRMIA